MSTQVKCNNLLPSLTMVHQLCCQSATRNFPSLWESNYSKTFWRHYHQHANLPWRNKPSRGGVNSYSSVSQGDFAEANNPRSICVKWSATLESNNQRSKHWNLLDSSAKGKNVNFVRDDFRQSGVMACVCVWGGWRWPREKAFGEGFGCHLQTIYSYSH